MSWDTQVPTRMGHGKRQDFEHCNTNRQAMRRISLRVHKNTVLGLDELYGVNPTISWNIQIRPARPLLNPTK